jgi:hypothetical protein
MKEYLIVMKDKRMIRFLNHVFNNHKDRIIFMSQLRGKFNIRNIEDANLLFNDIEWGIWRSITDKFKLAFLNVKISKPMTLSNGQGRTVECFKLLDGFDFKYKNDLNSEIRISLVEI